MRKRKNQFLFEVLIFAVVFFSSGCVHIDVTVALHEKDGGATITERIRITRKLQQACPDREKRADVLRNLSKEAALERMKHMGKGITLTSHEKKNISGGDIESVSVYTIPDVTQLRFPNPSLHAGLPGQPARLKLFPESRKTGGFKYGHMYVQFYRENQRAKTPKGIVKTVHSPADKQLMRVLRPVIADMLSDFRVSLKLKVPTRFSGGQVRGMRSGPRTATLFFVSGKDLDTSKNSFFLNREVMLDILQMNFNSGNIYKHASYFTDYSGTPVLRRKWGAARMMFYPTEYFSKKYFKGWKPAK